MPSERGFLRFLFGLLIAVSSIHSFAQSSYQEHYLEYEEALNSGDFRASARALDNFIAALVEESLVDSLYRYTFSLGQIHRKAYNSEQSISAAENHHELVLSLSADTFQILKSLNDLSWVYFEAGRHDLCVEADFEYLNLTQQYSQATVSDLYIAHYNMGFDYLNAGNTVKALSHFREAVDVIPQNDTAYVEQNINALNALGAALWHAGSNFEAKEVYRRAMEVCETQNLQGQRLANLSNILGNIALIEEEEGDYIASINNLRRAIEIKTKTFDLDLPEYIHDQNRRHLITNYRNLAALYQSTGDYPRALKLINYLSDVEETTYEESDPKRILTFDSFGAIYAAMGEKEKALAAYTTYLEKCLESFGEASFYTGGAYRNIGKVQAALRNEKAAINAYEQALNCFSKISDEKNAYTAKTLLDYADLLHSLGRDHEALARLDEAEAFYRSHRLSNDVVFAEIDLQRSAVFVDMNQANDALRTAQSALQLLQSRMSETQIGEDDQWWMSGRLLPEAYYRVARANSSTEGGSSNRELTLAWLMKGIESLKLISGAIDNDEARLAFQKQHTKVFSFAIDLAFEAFQESGSDSDLERFFRLVEESRSVLVRRRLNAVAVAHQEGVPEDILKMERDLLNHLTRVAGDDGIGGDYLALDKQYRELLKQIKQEYPLFWRTRYADDLPSLTQLKNEVVPDGGTLIQYIATEKRLFAMVTTEKSAFLTELDGTDLKKWIDLHAEALRSPMSQSTEVSEALYERLIAPVSEHFEGSRLRIIPDEALFRVNFETLVHPAGRQKPHYLIYDYTISYALSASSYLLSVQRELPQSSKVLAIAPGFSDQLKSHYLAQSIDSLTRDELYLHCIRQPFATRTADRLSKRFRGLSLTDETAVESAFKAKASEFGIIHFGTHTEINNDFPMLSRMILAKEGTGGDEDGYLHAYEIYDLKLNASMAVLTACETGVGKVDKSEGILSLAHSFVYAGSSSIVMTLWKIDEKTSDAIIDHFYAKLASGMSKDEALRAAKLNYLENALDELRDPYFWSGLVILGDTAPLQFSPAFLGNKALVIAGTLLLLVLLSLRLRRKGKH